MLTAKRIKALRAKIKHYDVWLPRGLFGFETSDLSGHPDYYAYGLSPHDALWRLANKHRTSKKLASVQDTYSSSDVSLGRVAICEKLKGHDYAMEFYR